MSDSREGLPLVAALLFLTVHYPPLSLGLPSLPKAGFGGSRHGNHHVGPARNTEGFENVVACCPVPIVIAGGKKLPELEALELCYKAIQCGAAGVDMGRNVFQSEDPVAMIQAVGGVVHDGLSPEEGFEKFNDLKSA